MIPTLKKVAEALVRLCKDNDVFNPTMLRRVIGIDFPGTEPAALSAQIQPHLRALRLAGAVKLIPSHQKRNRPYRVINRNLLIEISMTENYYIASPLPPGFEQDDDVEIDDEANQQNAVSRDETTNQIIDMERRLIALEETVELLVAKLGAVSTVLRP